jgi:hypothetical protein
MLFVRKVKNHVSPCEWFSTVHIPFSGSIHWYPWKQSISFVFVFMSKQSAAPQRRQQRVTNFHPLGNLANSMPVLILNENNAPLQEIQEQARVLTENEFTGLFQKVLLYSDLLILPFICQSFRYSFAFLLTRRLPAPTRVSGSGRSSPCRALWERTLRSSRHSTRTRPFSTPSSRYACEFEFVLWLIISLSSMARLACEWPRLGCWGRE